MPHGPFHRLESRTQTPETATIQVQTGEIWGRVARGGQNPCVKAYRNAMPNGSRGIEFTTQIAPHPGAGSPFDARWYHPETPGVQLKHNTANEDFAVITATVKNLQP